MTITGTQAGEIRHPVLDVPITGRQVKMDVVYIERMAGGKIVEEWEKQDTLGALQQLGFTPTPPRIPFQATRSKTLLRHFIEGLNSGEAAAAAAIDEIFSPDFVQHNAYGEEVRGIENYKKRVADLCRAALDLHFAIDDVVAEEDRVASRWTMTGTQTGGLHHAIDITATGRRVVAQWVAIHRIEGGKFVEAWERFDTLGLMKQLGFEVTLGKPVIDQQGGENR